MHLRSARQKIDGNLHSSSTTLPHSSGRLVALRTKAEVQVVVEVTHAHIVQIAQKSANVVVRAIDDALPKPANTTITLQHLRRFAKPTSLSIPTRLRLGCPLSQFNLPDLGADREADPNIHSSTDLTGHPSPSEAPFLYLLICADTTLSREQALKILVSTLSRELGSSPSIYTIPIPAQAPTSEDQALQWSRDYWPTVYKKHNSYGPHPSIVSRAEGILRPLAADWMGLAKKVSLEASESSLGERVGAIIVDPGMDEAPVAVVAAGDARWDETASRSQQNNGNVMAHAVMRAIGMVARKRRELLGIQEKDLRNAFLDYPTAPTEQAVFSRGIIKAGGYLCTELEIFVTHEPCVMCSMAILHSRFSKVVFATRMPRTGGLTAETRPGLGYGLWWLPDLNWKLLAWQWVDEELQDHTLPTTDIQA
ncbi:tRNA-specific adenosine deaminase subunit tad3 [Xylographa soralifera]|nr:tRNA-specific adenosine deaminase subunit tad3 [Xylographa soralifera]